MRPPYVEPEIEVKPSKKNITLGRIIKILALVFLILSITFIILGLMPQTKYGVKKPLQPVEVATSHAVDLQKGEILVLDYSVEGKDASFYLTYSVPWSAGSGDYIEKNDHAVVDHLEYEADKTGFYYLNFESNDPSTSGTFQVDLEYQPSETITDRLPLHDVKLEASLRNGKQTGLSNLGTDHSRFNMGHIRLNTLLSERFQGSFYYRRDDQIEVNMDVRDRPMYRTERLLLDCDHEEWRVFQIYLRQENKITRNFHVNS